MYTYLGILIAGIAVTLMSRARRQRERQRTVELFTQQLAAQKHQQEASQQAYKEEIRRATLKNWFEFKRDILDVYGYPETSYGPMPLDDMLREEPWANMQYGRSEAISPYDFFLLYHKHRFLCCEPYRIHIDHIDHIILHHEHTDDQGNITIHPMAEVYFRPGTPYAPEDMFEMLDLTPFNTSAEVMEVMRQFPELKIEYFKLPD